jgi:pyruvate dehydrogenase E2 component (dihydrolipoamide acetyltransferase)
VLLTVGGEGFQEPGVVVPEQGSGNVLIGYGTSEAPRRKRGRRRAAAPQAVAPQPVAASRPGVISPLVRKLARDNGIDVAALTGSGPNGIVRRHDVEQELARRVEVPAAVGERRIPLKGLRKTVADKLSTSRREIPEATVWVDVDATEFLAARAALKDVGLLALLARFTVLGLKKFPELNSRVDGDEIVVLDRVNLGFAAQTDRGLVVPVVKDAQDLTASQLSAALADRTAAARAGKLGTADLTGGTFTVNNYGVFGVDGSAAIINHPEAAILGMGRIIDRPWVVDGQLAVRKVCELTLAFDHRVCDGGVAGGFLRYVADCVESPVTALSDL